MKGTVKFFNTEKGFGFINGEDRKDYFFHISGLDDGATVDQGTTVEFSTSIGTRGPKAINIKLKE